MSVFTLSARGKITPQDLYMGYKYIRVYLKGSLHLACCGIISNFTFYMPLFLAIIITIRVV